MTTSRNALEAAVAAVTKADEALEADPTQDIAYRHRENAKVWLAIASGLARVEVADVATQMLGPIAHEPNDGLLGRGYTVRDSGLALVPGSVSDDNGTLGDHPESEQQ